MKHYTRYLMTTENSSRVLYFCRTMRQAFKCLA